MDLNILIVGVGGQGTLIASKILGNFAILNDKDCKLSEVHGMSQRGGSVVTHVRIADKVNSPVISEGDADIILAFEKLEALRWRHYLKKDGKIIINDREIMPMPVIIGMAEYPNDVYNIFSNENINYIPFDALDKAIEAGNAKAVNTVMIGKMSSVMNFDNALMKKALEQSIKPKLLEVNLVAYDLGYNSKLI